MEIILLVAAGFWFFCGIIAAGIASDKGNDGCGGFIVGVLFGPLGILIVAVAPVNPTYAEQQKKLLLGRQALAGELRKCPYCAEYVKREAMVCRYCGREIGASPDNTSTIERELFSQNYLKITNKRVIYKDSVYPLDRIVSSTVEGTGTSFWVRIKTDDGHEREIGHSRDRESAKKIAGMIRQEPTQTMEDSGQPEDSRPRNSEPLGPKISAENSRCGQCGRTNPPEFGFCGNCGSPLVAPQMQNSDIHCPRCNEPDPPESRYCGTCGATLLNSVPQEDQGDTK